MKKFLFLIAACFISLSVEAQIKNVVLQAAGLTCAMCSNAIHQSLKTLSFVDEVKPDLERSAFTITFKSQSIVDFDAMKKKVEDAGFTVASFEVGARFSSLQPEQGKPVLFDRVWLQFINTDKELLDGNRRFNIVDKGYLSSRRYKEYAKKGNLPTASQGKRVYGALLLK
ncbi:MAG: heavy-metal-associated domain-containing protein [Bacteroidetes bacterium]|nr:heavy-metal-associated domain-containing protein [Bacteroidota bacterium]